MLGDIRNERLLYLKAGLFLLMGAVASAILIADRPEWRTALLLAISIWSFSRAYYFAFYVVEKYADPNYKFSGLFDFAKYLWRRQVKR